MEILRIDKDLPLINEVIMFPDTDQLQLKPVWSMWLWSLIRMLKEVIWFNLTMLLNPSSITHEEFIWMRPRLHFNKLFSIFTKTGRNQLVVLSNINSIIIISFAGLINSPDINL
jgi:hypothetical protein